MATRGFEFLGSAGSFCFFFGIEEGRVLSIIFPLAKGARDHPSSLPLLPFPLPIGFSHSMPVPLRCIHVLSPNHPDFWQPFRCLLNGKKSTAMQVPVLVLSRKWQLREVLHVDQNTKRESGRRVQLGNIEAAKVSLLCGSRFTT